MATSKDVAKLAGVSHTTVSRAFRGDVRLRPETYEKVMSAARTLHYAPNFMASGLKKRRSQMVSLLLSDLGNPFFTVVANQLELELNRAGYRLLLSVDGGDPERQKKILADMAAAQAAAIVFTPYDPSCLLPAGKAGYIQLFHTLSPELPSIVFDDCLGAYRGAAHLLEKGHRNILLLGGLDRRAGYERAFAEYGLEPRFFTDCYADPAGRIEGLKQEIQRRRPTAVFAVGNHYATCVGTALKELGLAFPADISLLLFDDSDWARLMDISVISHPIGELARALAERVLALIEGKSRPDRMVFNPFLIERGSVRDISVREADPT